MENAKGLKTEYQLINFNSTENQLQTNFLFVRLGYESYAIKRTIKHKTVD